MTTTFPQRDPVTGELTAVTYWSPSEVAPMLHLSEQSVRRRLARGQWPHLAIGRVYWMSAEHVDRIVQLMTHDVDAIQPAPIRLGAVVLDEQLESIQ